MPAVDPDPRLLAIAFALLYYVLAGPLDRRLFNQRRAKDLRDAYLRQRRALEDELRITAQHGATSRQ